MSYTGFRFPGRNATLTRPDDKPQAVAGATWARDRSSPNADDGTEVDATFLNRLRANLEAFVTGLGGSLGDGDNQLKNAALAKFALYTTSETLSILLAEKAGTGHTHQIDTLSDGGGYVRMTDAERAKLASLAANYKGSFASLAAVVTAYPSASAGDWAIISRVGDDASIALWDSDATPAAWVDVDAAPPATASSTPFTPAGSIAATNVQSAIEELDSEKQATLGFTAVPNTRSISGSGLASGGGNFTADRTIDVPIASQAEAEAGSVNDKAMTPLRTAQAISKLSPVRAWVKFDIATGAVAAASNVTSVTKNTTGQFTVNFTNAMPSANYAVVATHTALNSSSSSTYVPSQTTTSCGLNTWMGSGAASSGSCFAVFVGG